MSLRPSLYNNPVPTGRNFIKFLHFSSFRKICHKCSIFVNLLNAKLNPICHLLVLLGDLTFMGSCIVSIFQYISNKLQSYTIYLYLKTALHVSGSISIHHQEFIQLYLQHLVFVTPLLLSAAIVEEVEPV
jgi:hypothetical protein